MTKLVYINTSKSPFPKWFFHIDITDRGIACVGISLDIFNGYVHPEYQILRLRRMDPILADQLQRIYDKLP